MSFGAATFPEKSAIRGLVSFFGAWAIGSSGAPTRTFGKVMDVARTAAGKYTVTFQNNDIGYLVAVYPRVHGATGMTGLGGMCTGFAYTANVTSSTSTLLVEFSTAGTPTDPVSGAVFTLEVIFATPGTTP